MTPSSAFDHRPDPRLGALLKDALTADGEPAFLARVQGAAESLGSGYPVVWWQVLGTWARHGVAAVLVLAAGATIWWSSASTRNEAETSIEEVLIATAEPVAPPFLTATTAPPSFDVVLASSLEPWSPR